MDPVTEAPRRHMESSSPTTALLMKGAQTQQLSEARSMDLHNAGISEIDGLEVCPKLRSLDMSFNKIRDLKNLDCLPELRELKLYDNHILHIKGMLALTALQSLDLSGNQVENIEGVSHLKQLISLRLRNNKISELAGLGKMPCLEYLDASHNKIHKIENLQGCTALKELVLNGNKITAIEGLGRCSRLTELALNGNRLTSLRGLKEVSSSIDILWVCENQLESLRGIPDSLPKLTELYIADNKLTSLQPLDKCCPEMELLDVSRNKLASIKRLAVVLGPLEGLVELKAEGNAICHQPEGQPSYRERVLGALPRLKYLDEEVVPESERIWLQRDQINLEQEDDSLSHVPTMEEMEEFKRRMGIQSVVPPMGSPGLSRPSSAGQRPCSARSLSRHSSSSRPSTPSEALPAGTAPVGPLGRPSTPRSLGQPVLQGKAIGTPLMNQRPLSARSSGTEVVMKPEQYEASLVEFTDTMNQYQMQMQDVIARMRVDLKMDLSQATAAVRANGMSVGQNSLTSVLPKPPQLPTFATRSDTDFAMKKETKMRMAFSPAKAKPPTPVRSQSKGQHLLELQVSFLNAAMSTESEPTKPGVSNPIHTMPHKTSELLEYYTQLFPEEKDESSEEMELDNTDAQDPSPPPGDVSGQLPQAPPDWRSAGGKSYKAAGGFQRMDMDNLCDEANAIGQRKTQTVDPRGTATGSSWCENPSTDDLYAEDYARSNADFAGKTSHRDKLMSKLNMLEHMVSAYGSSETSDESSHKADVADEDNGIRQGVVYGDSMGTQHEGPSVYSKFRLPGKPGVQALPSANASGKTASQRPVSATNKKLQTRATGGLLRKK